MSDVIWIALTQIYIIVHNKLNVDKGNNLIIFIITKKYKIFTFFSSGGAAGLLYNLGSQARTVGFAIRTGSAE